MFKDQKLRDFLGFFGTGLEMWSWQVIWPTFIFFTILGSSYVTLGSVASLSLFLSVAGALLVGKFSDVSRRLVLRIGALLNAATWLVRMFITTSFQVFFVDAFYGMSQIAAYIPLDALSYDKANQADIVEYISFRETSIHIGGVFLFLVMMLLGDLPKGFIFGVAGSFLQLLF